MRLSIEPRTALWHQQLFRLDFEVPEARAVLVHYHNGIQRPWHLKTNRKYRFRRWFWRKGKDSFRNLANPNRPWIDLYVVESWFSWPKRVRITLNVGRVDLNSPDLSVSEYNVRLKNAPVFKSAGFKPVPAGIRINETSMRHNLRLNINYVNIEPIAGEMPVLNSYSFENPSSQS